MIGLKLADGSFYPLLEEGVPKTKKITLTTAQDNQETVHIVLVRGSRGDSGEDLVFIRELFLQGLRPAPRGVPDITLILSLNEDLELHAQLDAPEVPPDWNYEAPRGPSGGRLKRSSPKYGESSVPSDMSAAELAAAGVFIRPNAVSLAAFVVLGFFICAVIAFAVFAVFRASVQAPLVQGVENPFRAVLFSCFFPAFRARKRSSVFTGLTALGAMGILLSCVARPSEEPQATPQQILK
ncbi:MAG: Hsp70 family protein, partial [Spirochaetaceae bacterium]|nr:Hsp70 family protein [Spirochaetaceae bacterium]